MSKRGFVKSPHGKIYKDYEGDLTVILSFLGEYDTLFALIFVYCPPDNCSAEIIKKGKIVMPAIRIRKGFVVTKYSGSKHSLLYHLKHSDKALKKIVKNDLKPLWTIDKTLED